MADRSTLHHVYLIPGLFGFGKLAGLDYFEHLERALAERFERAGKRLHMEVVPAPPTASIPLRASIVAQLVAHTSSQDSGPIHLVGHSTGGLDARLLMAPGIAVPADPEHLRWLGRVESVLCINTPHYGTPLAGYFTTVAGTRALYALSLFTVASLGLGRIPLSLASSFLSALGGVDKRLGIQLTLLDDLKDRMLRVFSADARAEIADYLQHVKHDQGGIMQLMPEVMELFNATVVDNPRVRYGCIASASPAPSARTFGRSALRPIRTTKLGIYSLLYGISARAAQRYPYATPLAEHLRMFERAGVPSLSPSSVDGVVPTLSMLWGELIWCGAGDHLDVVGHFHESDEGLPKHVDWLQSGAQFRYPTFATMADSVAAFLLREPANATASASATVG